MTNLTIHQKDNILRILLSTASIDSAINEKEIVLYSEIANYLNKSEDNLSTSVNSVDPSAIFEDWEKSAKDDKYYLPTDSEEIAVLLILQYMMVAVDGELNDRERIFLEDFVSSNFALRKEILPEIKKASEITINEESLRKGREYLEKAFEDHLMP